ncbi:MAG TPA: ATPase, partial [Clostridiales bacterium]|nr:ATPase [Clostridiales bacterium]
EEKGVSTVLVVGGSGDYFDVADTVIMMDNYLPRDVTRRAKEIAGRFGRERRTEAAGAFGEVTPRCPVASSLDPRRGRGDKVKIAARDLHTITFGREEIDLSAVEQLVDPSQTRAIADAIHYAARRHFDGRTPLREALERVMADIRSRGLGVISPFAGRDGEGHPGEYALPRVFELGAAVNRLRTLRVVQRRPHHGARG